MTTSPTTASDCPICFSVSDSHGQTELMELECGHAFHARCIVGWFRRGASTCPLCRHYGDDAHNLVDGFTLRERARYLRTRVVRRKNAPRELVRMVNSVRTIEAQAATAKRELRELKRTFRGAFSEAQRLQGAIACLSRRRHSAMRTLGAFSCSECPMPPLLVHR